MMKRLFSAIVALTFVTALSAQMIQKNPAEKFGQQSVESAQKTPMLAGEDNIVYWSYFNGSASSWNSIGIGQAATLSVAVKLPDFLAGGTLKSINIPIKSSSMTEVTAWVRTNLDGENLVLVNVPSNSFVPGSYVKAPLTEDFTIPATDVYVGYTFTSTAQFPVAVGAGSQPNSLFLKINDDGWGDYSNQGFGISPLQLSIANLNLSEYNVKLRDLESLILSPNKPFKARLTVDSNGKNAINTIDYTIEIDGKKEQKQFTFKTPIPAGLNQSGIAEVEGTSPSDHKYYTVKVTLDKVNGQNYDKTASVSAEFINILRNAPRRTVVEEFTGTGCGWCTRGWVGMEYMKEHYQDQFVGIAFHQYNNNDPMYVANYYPYASLGIKGAPSCNMNRKMVMDPFEGSGAGIWQDLLLMNEEPPLVDVSATGVWNDTKTAVDVTANIEPLTDGLGFTVAYVLTADQLSGTTAEWRQSNYYYQYSSSSLPTNPDLAQFGSGGKNGQSSVYLTFNDVMIGSSYNSMGRNLAPVIDGSTNSVAGTVYEGKYSVKMPTKTVLKNAIKIDQVFANVLIISNKTGEILNAVRVKVGEDTNAIDDANVADDVHEVACYSLDGRRLDAPQKGVNIVKFSNGKTMKKVKR
ncbi:MAG: hypothetical protein II934_08440 [Prevotella sp.]|nr:hypothetical protein [Prevotella sp.]